MNLIVNIIVRWQKMALLVLGRVGLCIGQNQMCHLCGWLKLFLKNVQWKKIKIKKRWLLGRLSVGSFVPLLYVYFCCSFLLCRLLGLQVTFSGLEKVAIFTTKFHMKNRISNIRKTVLRSTEPTLLPNPCYLLGLLQNNFLYVYCVSLSINDVSKVNALAC